VLSAGLVAPGSCLQSQTGEMFFGGADGLYAFHPEKIRENLVIPPVAITALKIFNETVRRALLPDEQIRLSHQENYISFEFAALDFVAPEKNQYAYMLEGLDRDWVYAGTRRHVDYPNLRPGDYVFRVKGSNNDGVWNEKGAAVRITVEPPFWQTWTFRGIVLVVLVVSVISGYRQRVRSIEAHSRQLEAQVKERTSQLEALYRADEELYRHLHLDQVLQALMSKCHPSRGIVKVEHALAWPLFPWLSEYERGHRMGARVYFDCTWPVHWDPSEVPVRMSFNEAYPKEVQQKALEKLRKFGF